MPGPIQLFNARFLPLTLQQTVDQLFADLAAGRRGWLETVNVAILMMMRADDRLQSFVDRARWVVVDGQPLVWTSKLYGTPLPERVSGVDLVEPLCAGAESRGLGVYLLGASQDVVEAVAQRLQSQFPKLKLHHANGYFSAAEAAQRAEAVAASGASILFVAMGVPRQEVFIEQQWERLGVGLAIGVGGSFDVLAGIRKRAPVWVQNIGMEWFYRLIQEPGRMWKRYLVTNTQFILLFLKGWLIPSLRRK